MNRSALCLCLLGLATGLAQAEPPRQEIRVIPKTYISPGASGSVGGYGQWEQRHYIGGQPVPVVPLHERESTILHEQRSTGGIRQTIEYPGLRIERQPGREQQHYRQVR